MPIPVASHLKTRMLLNSMHSGNAYFFPDPGTDFNTSLEGPDTSVMQWLTVILRVVSFLLLVHNCCSTESLLWADFWNFLHNSRVWTDHRT